MLVAIIRIDIACTVDGHSSEKLDACCGTGDSTRRRGGAARARSVDGNRRDACDVDVPRRIEGQAEGETADRHSERARRDVPVRPEYYTIRAINTLPGLLLRGGSPRP